MAGSRSCLAEEKNLSCWIADTVQLRVMQTRADSLILTQVQSDCHMQSCMHVCIRSHKWWDGGSKNDEANACTAIWIAAENEKGSNPSHCQLEVQMQTH